MSTQPRQIQYIIESLGDALRDWQKIMGLADEQARAAQTSARRGLDLYREHADQVQATSQDYAAASDRLNTWMAQVRQDADAGMRMANAAHDAASSARGQADQAVSLWQSAAHRARQQLQAREGELADARMALRNAEMNLNHAQAELSNAHSAYNSCQNSYTTDSRGNRQAPNCSAQASRVNAANHAVGMAQGECSRCQGEVQRCVAAVSQAQGILAQCERGLGNARHGLSIALDAVRQAQDASNLAREGMALASQAAQSAAELAAESRQAQEDVASAQVLAGTSLGHIDMLQTHVTRLGDNVSEHVSHAARSNATLDDAFEALRAYDQAQGL